VSVLRGRYGLEWFNASTGRTVQRENVAVTTSNSSVTFTPPFSGDAVLYLKAR
jgi:hypothetical protein